MQPTSLETSKSQTAQTTQLPAALNIGQIYQKRKFLQYPQMKELFYKVLKSKDIRTYPADQILFPSNFLEPENKSLKRRFTRQCRSIAIKFKRTVSSKYDKKYDQAATKIANAYYARFNKDKTPTPKPSVTPPTIHTPQEDPHKEIRGKVDLLAKAIENVDNQMKTKHDRIVAIQNEQKSFTLENADCYKDSRDAYLINSSKLEELKEKKTKAEEYQNTYVGSFWSYMSNSAVSDLEALKKEIAELEPQVIEEKEAYEKLQARVDDQKKTVEELKTEESKLSKEFAALGVERGKIVLESQTLKKTVEDATGVPYGSEPISAAIEIPQTVAKREVPNFGSFDSNFKYVSELIKKSIMEGTGTKDAKEKNIRRTFGYLKKPVQTPVLQMSGITDQELVMKKSAMAVRILSLALTEEKNNERLTEVVASFLDSLLSMNPKVTDLEKQQIGDLVKFAFGMDPETKAPRMDEGLRLRGLSIIMGCVLILSHYFFDPDSLTKEIRSLRFIFHSRVGKFTMKAAVKTPIYQSKKHELIDSVREISLFQASHQKDITNLIDVLEPVIIDMMSDESSEMTKRIMYATKIFANQDFKPFLDLIDISDLPTTTEFTEACANLFEKFVSNLKIES